MTGRPRVESPAPRALLLALGFLFVARAAMAHEQVGAAAGFLAGLGHPVSGLDHVLAMIAVGVWGAQLGAPALWLLPVTFPMVMALGGFVGLVGIPLPGVEVAVGLSALVLGALIATEARLPLGAAALLVGFFAVFHGHAHGVELPPGQSGLTYSIGFVVATGSLHAAGIALGPGQVAAEAGALHLVADRAPARAARRRDRRRAAEAPPRP